MESGELESRPPGKPKKHAGEPVVQETLCISIIDESIRVVYAGGWFIEFCLDFGTLLSTVRCHGGFQNHVKHRELQL